jgi:hypothetical protein
MIETTILSYLMSALGDVPVFAERPVGDEIPDKYVVIEKTGSSTENHIETATLAIKSYGGTMYKAAVLNEKLKQYMDAAVALPNVSSVKLNSDYNYTDVEEHRYRYQAVFDVITFDEV